MKQLRNKQILVLTLLITMLGWFGWWIMLTFFNSQLFEHYVIIPVSYYLAGLALITVLYKTDKTKPQRLAQTYLLMHTLKLVVFGCLALIFVLAFGIKTKMFIVIYAAYYLVFLVFETLTFYSVEKKLKSKQNESIS
jgi:hypothetical protein